MGAVEHRQRFDASPAGHPQKVDENVDPLDVVCDLTSDEACMAKLHVFVWVQLRTTIRMSGNAVDCE